MDQQSNDYYGAPADSDIKTLGERLRDAYEPSDFVTVMNVDTQPVKYQFARPDDIETYSEYAGHKETTQKRVPTVVTLQPGQTKLCPAYEADLMIETLIKQITAKRTQVEIEDGTAVKWQSANWSDPKTQKDLIAQIFIGKEDIVKSYNADRASDAAAEKRPVKAN